MATLNEMVYNVRNTPSGGRSHRAHGFSNRHIEFMLRACRGFLIYADIKNNGQPNPQFQQDLGCIQLTTVDQADCPRVEWGEDVKKCTLPRLIDGRDEAGRSINMLMFFGKIDKRTRIHLPNEDMGILDDYLQYKKKNAITAMQIGQTIYLYGKAAMKLCYVNARGIFYDPTLVYTCGAEGLEPRCFDKDTDCYPVPAHLEQALYDMVFEKYIDKGRLPEDLSNDERKETIA